VSNNECHACGKKWEDHKGVVWTCEELHKLRALTDELCRVLLCPGLTISERHIRMGLVIGDIRELNKEDFDERVAKPCGLSF